MDQTLQMVLAAKNQTEATFAQFVAGQKAMQDSVDRTDKKFQDWTATQQRAAQRMEAMHEEALKMNSAFKSASDDTQRAANTLAAFDSALGGPIQNTKGLSATLDLAGVGFKNLKTTAMGFNAATAGVVGAGLSIGLAIGSWLNTFPAVTKATDDLRDSLMLIVGMKTPMMEMAAATAGLAKQQAEVAKANVEATKKQLEWQTKHGQNTKEAIEYLQGKAKPVLTAGAGLLQELAEKHEKAAAAANKHREQQKRLDEEFERGRAAANEKHWTEFYEKEEKKWEAALSGLVAADKANFEATQAVLNQRIMAAAGMLMPIGKNFGDLLNQQLGAAGGKGSSWGPVITGELKRSLKAGVENLPQVILGAIQGGGDVGRAIGASLGASIGSGLGETLKKSIGGTLGGAIGGVAGPLGALLGGGIGSLFSGLFGGEGKKTNDMRDQFIAAAGGLDALNRKAKEAGMTLDALLRAKDRNALQGAIDQLNNAFGITDQATQKVKDAMREFGIEIGQMGPKFAQQELDQQAMSLFEKYKLLTQAGADHNLVIDKMGPSMIEYVNQARQAGAAIPEDMRKIVEELLAQGKILDENGQAFQTAEEAGITFGSSLQDSMGRAAEQMERLVEAISRLYGLGDINIPVNVHPNISSPGDRGGGDGDVHSLAGGGVVTGWGVPAVLHGTDADPEVVLRSQQLKQIVAGAVQAAAAANGGSRPAHISVGPTYLDGAVVTRQVAKRQGLGYGREKRNTRRM
jgi:hypothetical protein